MNLSYIVNDLKTKPSVKKVSYASGVIASGGEQDIFNDAINSEGYSFLSMDLIGAGGVHSSDVFLQGRSNTSIEWINIPVYNSRYIMQPYICIRNAYLTNSMDVGRGYFANISSFSEIRTNVKYSSGLAFSIGLTLSNLAFKINEPTIIGEYNGITSGLTRPTEFVGRLYRNINDAKTNPSAIYPIWTGGVSSCEIVLENNTNRDITISEIRLCSRIDQEIAFPTEIIKPMLIVKANSTINLTSWDYPTILKYGGFSITIISQTDGVPTPEGSYNILINVKK